MNYTVTRLGLFHWQYQISHPEIGTIYTSKRYLTKWFCEVGAERETIRQLSAFAE